ncbi:MAG: glycosyltransferase [Pseudomonadota bacterium]
MRLWFPVGAFKGRHFVELGGAILRGDLKHVRRRLSTFAARVKRRPKTRSLNATIALLEREDWSRQASFGVSNVGQTRKRGEFAGDVSTLVTCQQAKRLRLVVDHAIGGGANLYRQEFVEASMASGCGVLLLTYDDLANLYVVTALVSDRRADFHCSSLKGLRKLFQQLPPDEVVYNNIASYPDPLEILTLLEELTDRSSTLTILIHDYLPVCPSYNLIGANGSFCSIPSESECRKCLPVNRFADKGRQIDIAEWRVAWRRILTKSTFITCFSSASRAWLERAYPEQMCKVKIHPHKPPEPFPRHPKLALEQPLHIGVVGTITHAKGLHIVEQLAEFMCHQDPEARLTIVGDVSKPLSAHNLNITGRYDRRDLPYIFERHGINVCLFPSIWPETYSYVVDEIMALKVPLCCFELGAPAERVRCYVSGRTIASTTAIAAYKMALLTHKACNRPIAPNHRKNAR